MNSPDPQYDQNILAPPSDYTNSGFDDFLDRSIDGLVQKNLDSEGPIKKPYDRVQIGDAIGKSMTLGRIRIDGVNGKVYIADTRGNETLALS